ncbi:MAG: pyrroline-5-carboxylate reductase, partial [Rhodospirillaceae bacterium]|nr:pyrroline-5-carboxylate reductase [Rhodospirillaceae bacterium]
VGEVAWLADEAHMDAVTAVSGSGPAYVFLMVEALRDAGVAAGLPADVAEHLARAAAIGSGALLERDAAAAPDVLRHNVTSPGGTTAAALSVLMGENGLKELMTRAVAAAAKRSKELAG